MQFISFGNLKAGLVSSRKTKERIFFFNGENITPGPCSQGAGCTSMNPCPQTGSLI